jgi:glycosyltransferase involved in cell wall biosynthesis
MVKKTANLKLALVHDYLREYGGAERVLEQLHVLYPDAPVYVGFIDAESLGSQWPRFADWDIRTTWLQRIPGIKRLFSPLRFLAPSAFSSLDLSAYDVVISSSNAYFAKAVRSPHGKHICYCHTPPRSLYGYSTMSDWKKKPVINALGQVLNHFLRLVDFQIAQKVGIFVANSRETQARIKKFYHREAEIINPPVVLPKKIAPADKKTKNYYLYVNRLAFAKHPEMAVAACQQLSLPLKVVGAGPMLDQLQAMATPGTEFLGSVTDEQLSELYQGAIALLYPVEDEDFGMIPVEAMGHGVPVIAHRSGGPRETIVEEETGLFFDELSVRALVEAMHLAKSYSWDRQKIHLHAKKFSVAVFDAKIKALVDRVRSAQ